MTSAARDSLASAGAPKPEAMATARVNTSSSESETESDDSSVFVDENLFFADSEEDVESPTSQQFRLVYNLTCMNPWKKRFCT